MSNEKMKMPEEEFGIPLESQHQASRLGMVLSLLILALILLLVGLYYWGTALRDATEVPTLETFTRPTAQENNEPESTRAEAEVSSMGALSTSDNLDLIEADLSSTDLTDLEAELITIERELDAATE